MRLEERFNPAAEFRIAGAFSRQDGGPLRRW
jgi:hypothetical protein